MAELPTGQLIAAIFAALLILVGVIGIVRLTNVTMVILLFSFLAIPTLGLIAYVIAPRPPMPVDFVYLSLPFALAALIAFSAGMLLALIGRKTPRFSSMHRRVPLVLIAWPCVVMAISGMVAIFEPGFAAANLAANGVWFLLWLPRPMRRVNTTNSYELAASPARVFDLVSQPTNWPLYNKSLEAATVTPPGQLAVGSLITLRHHVEYPGLRGPRMLVPKSIDLTSVVTRLVPNQVLATRRTDLPDSSDETVLTPTADGGTRITGRAMNVLAYRYAVLGTRVGVWRDRAKVQAAVKERQERVRALLEGA